MLICSDLHLTDRERDEYRWDFFKWIAKQLKKRNEDTLLILGDLTDEKDGHTAKLVNRIVDTLLDLPAHVFVLKGNHDYKDADCAFFRFLGREGFCDKLDFISTPKWLQFVGKEQKLKDLKLTTLMLPHTADPMRDWADIDLKGVEVICCHQTYNGADAGGGFKLSSALSNRYWSEERGFKGKIISGDIHVAQTLGDVEYVGCPYPVHFGDAFETRVLQVERHNGAVVVESIQAASIQRAVVDVTINPDTEVLDIEDALGSLRKGDQAKVRVHLPRAEFAGWEMHKGFVQAYAKENGIWLFSVELREVKRRKKSVAAETRVLKPGATPGDILERFALARGLDPSLLEIGETMITSRT